MRRFIFTALAAAAAAAFAAILWFLVIDGPFRLTPHGQQTDRDGESAPIPPDAREDPRRDMEAPAEGAGGDDPETAAVPGGGQPAAAEPGDARKTDPPPPPPADFIEAVRLLAVEAAAIQSNAGTIGFFWGDEGKARMTSKLVEVLGDGWARTLAAECSARPGSTEADFVFYLMTELARADCLKAAVESLEKAGIHRFVPNFYLSRQADSEAAKEIRRILSGPAGEYADARKDQLLHPLYLAMMRGSGSDASNYFCGRAQSAPSPEARRTFLGHLAATGHTSDFNGLTAMLRSEQDAGCRSLILQALAHMACERHEEVDALIEWSMLEPSPEIRAAVAGLLALKSPSAIGRGGGSASSFRPPAQPANPYLSAALLADAAQRLRSDWNSRAHMSLMNVRIPHEPGWTRIVDALEDLLSDQSEKVRVAAATALADVVKETKSLKTEDVVVDRIRTLLKSASTGDPSQAVRDHALKQLARVDE